LKNKDRQDMYYNLKLSASKKKTGGLAAFAILLSENDSIREKLSRLHININETIVNQFEEGERENLLFYNSGGNIELLYLEKVKINKKFTNDYFRNSGAGLIKKFYDEKVTSVEFILPDFEKFDNFFSSQEELAGTFIEGLFLGNYLFDKYLSEKKKTYDLRIHIHGLNNLKSLFTQTKSLMGSVYFTRDLVNEPAIYLNPQQFVKNVSKELDSKDVKVKVFGKNDLEEMGANALLSVGKASENPPLMMIIKYKPKGNSLKKIALVGKGVMYDSGGLSIKTTQGMFEMKADMAGAAVVAGVIKAASDAHLPVEITGIIPSVENMISGGAYKPGDIIHTMSGKTIEVGDTDAEGRLILADALEYACSLNPDIIIDFATLTGAAFIALGQLAAALFTHDDKLSADLIAAGEKSYERLWRMPLWEDYAPLLKSPIADIKNLGPRGAGAITAAKFLEFFVADGQPWAHIDLAGPAIQFKHNNYSEPYNTGYGIRLIFNYLSSIE